MALPPLSGHALLRPKKNNMCVYGQRIKNIADLPGYLMLVFFNPYIIPLL
jgi:hypothetical protein